MTKRHSRQHQRRARAPGHDGGYKLLYSHVAMVRDLVQHFLPGDWSDQLDLTSLEKCSGSYVSDDLRDRCDDLIWRVRWGPEWLYLYLLLEFQSTIDTWMAVRIQTYVGLLYQDLIRTGQLSAASQLPPVLPIVLYNGIKPWDAGRQLEALIAPGPAILRDYRPRQGYYLLDEIRIAEAGGLPERNLSAALFRLEASRTPAEVLGILTALVEWLHAPEQTSLRRAFTVWISRVFLPRRLPGVAIESMNDLHEVRSMLAERYETWTEQWQREGLEKGLKEGLKKGRQEGEAVVLQRLLTLKFGPPDASSQRRIATADADTLLRWSERVLTAQRLDEVLGEE